MAGKGMRAVWKSKDADRGYKALRRQIESIGQRESYARVGVFGAKADRKDGEPVDNVGLAIIHEYGAPRASIPERSFLRSTVDAGRAEYATLTKKLINGVLRQRFTVQQALGLLGVRVAADVQKRIKAGIDPANMPEVFLAKLRKGDNGKGLPVPLIDTAKLLQSITSDVVMKHAIFLPPVKAKR